MCGIVGMVSTAPDVSVVQTMVDRLRHRGPDDSGIEVLPGCVLGHARLSIIDLSSAGHQPMCNEDGSIWCVFNGEVYNYRALLTGLKKKGHVLKGESDTQAIIHGYEEYGLGFFSLMDGMFALALYDNRSRTLILARDYFGKKPLFYWAADDRIVFASELKALLPALERRPSLNMEAYESYLCLQYTLTSETIFQGVKKVPPATYIVFQEGREKRRVRFWSLDSHPMPDTGDASPCEAVRELVFKAVEKRMESDVPLGVLLSGGLDSSIVTAAMSKIQNKPVKTFTAGFGEAGDEFAYARHVARQNGTDHAEVLIQAADVKELLPRIVYHADEPLADGGGYATFLMAEKIKPHASVLLVGEGADEIFGGYSWHRLGLPVFNFAPAAFRLRLYLYLNSFAPFYLQNRLWPKFKKIISSQSGSDGSAGDKFMPGLFWFERSELLPNSLLMKVDRMMMAFGVEPRAPFLDRDLVRYVSSLPVRDRIGKGLLRQAFADSIPREVLQRSKQGFRLPFHKWLHGELHQDVRALLLDSSSMARQYWTEKGIQDLFAKALTPLGRISRDCMLWRLYIFELWRDALGVRG